MFNSKLLPIYLTVISVVSFFLLFFGLKYYNFNSNSNSFELQVLREKYRLVYNELQELKSNTNILSNKMCPIVPPKLLGRLQVFNESSETFEEMEELFSWLEPGGRNKPQECVSRNKVAIIVPYRDREQNLRTFLYNIHPVLKRQQLDYGLYVVEQNGDELYNKGKLMNVGFLEALRQYDYQCVIFHDVDLIPEDDRNLYICPEKDIPRHMAVAVEQYDYKLIYENLFGGVVALTTEQFKRINGFSNEYLGWGAEDDDLLKRVRYYGYNMTRAPAEIARYKSLEHKPSEINYGRHWKLVSSEKRYKTDGINSTYYRLIELDKKKLFTWILVDVD